MADPVTLAILGATAGAALSPKDPLKGALMGGTLGFGGGALMGAGAAGAAGAGAAGSAGAAGAAAAPLGTSMYASAVPGLTSSAAGSQAAHLAAQTAGMGLPGLASTGASATYAGAGGPLASGFFNAANSAMLPSAISPTQNSQLMMASNMLGGQQQQQQQAPIMPMQMRQGRPPEPNNSVLSLLQTTPRRREMISLLG
jgi:hypothetical protein